MTSQPWSEMEDSRLRLAANRGVSYGEIAQRLGRTPNAVRSRAKRLGFEPRAVATYRPTAADRAAIVEYLRTKTIGETVLIVRHTISPTISWKYVGDISAAARKSGVLPPLKRLEPEARRAARREEIACSDEVACDMLLRRHIETGCHWINDPALMRRAVERLAA